MIASADVDRVFDAVATRLPVNQPRAWVVREIAKLLQANVDDDPFPATAPQPATAAEPSPQSPTRTRPDLRDQKMEDMVARASQADDAFDILQWLRSEWLLLEVSSALRVKARVSRSSSERRRDRANRPSSVTGEATRPVAPPPGAPRRSGPRSHSHR